MKSIGSRKKVGDISAQCHPEFGAGSADTCKPEKSQNRVDDVTADGVTAGAADASESENTQDLADEVEWDREELTEDAERIRPGDTGKSFQQVDRDLDDEVDGLFEELRRKCS